MNTSFFSEKYIAHDFTFRDYRQAFEKAKINIRFPIAHEVLFSLTDRMDTIYQGMLALGDQENIYCSFILYRSLIDHFIKTQYILDKTCTTGTDSTAEHYKKHYFISEVLGEQGGELEMERLIAGGSSSPDLMTFLKQKFPELADFDKDNNKEISASTGQFKLSPMVKYLTNRYQQDLGVGNMANILAQTLPEFAQVSSFTHGGPYANQILQSIQRDGKINEQLTKQLHIGLTMTGVCKENNFLVYEIDRSFISVLQEMQDIRSFIPTEPAEKEL